MFICSCSLHDSLIVSFCDHNTAQISFMISNVFGNALSSIFLFTMALGLHGQPPSVGFSCKLFASLALVSLALFLVLRSHVFEPKTAELTEPGDNSSTMKALLYGIQTPATQRCLNPCF